MWNILWNSLEPIKRSYGGFLSHFSQIFWQITIDHLSLLTVKYLSILNVIWAYHWLYQPLEPRFNRSSLLNGLITSRIGWTECKITNRKIRFWFSPHRYLTSSLHPYIELVWLSLCYLLYILSGFFAMSLTSDSENWCQEVSI